MVCGELPKKWPKSRSTQLRFDFSECMVNLLSSVTRPTMYTGALSLSHILINSSIFSFFIINPILSWDSFPIISLFESVGSPIGKLSNSINPPVSSTSSVKQFKWPPAPWSWIETIQFFSFSKVPLMAFATLFCISGLDLWIAFNSIPVENSPVSADETAAPPIPIL